MLLLLYMINIPLPNNRLILNGHRIFTKEQLFLYLSKKLKTEVSKEQEIQELLSMYKELMLQDLAWRYFFTGRKLRNSRYDP